MTPVNHYCNTPHKTIDDLCLEAKARTQLGEQASEIVQDIVDGYGLGWGSANHDAIILAIWTANK